MVSKVSYVDFSLQYNKQREKILESLDQTLSSGQYILGEEVKKFEKSFAKLCQTKHAIGVANGTDAITIALKSLNLPNKSEVIIPAMTYCSTAFAVINANLKPILVDTEYLKPTMSLIDLKKKNYKKNKSNFTSTSLWFCS